MILLKKFVVVCLLIKTVMLLIIAVLLFAMLGVNRYTMNSKRLRPTLRKIFLILALLASVILMVTVGSQRSCLTVNAAGQQGENAYYPDKGTPKFLYPSGGYIADGHFSNDTYAYSRVFSITPGQHYVLRLLAPSGSGYYNRFTVSGTRLVPDVGVYCNWTQSGESIITHTASDIYYEFTAGDYDNFLVVHLNFGYDYDTTMEKSSKLIGGINTDNTDYGLTIPLDNLSTTSVFYTTAGLPTEFNLQAVGGFGSYQYDIYASPHGENDWTFIADSSSSGNVNYLLPVAYTDLIDVRIGVENTRCKYFDKVYKTYTLNIWGGDTEIPDSQTSLPVDDDIDYSSLPDVSLTSDNNVASAFSGAFNSFPVEFAVMLVPSVVLSFLGWWLLK